MSDVTFLLQEQTGSLDRLLLELKRQECTGAVKLCTKVTENGKELECFLLLNEGRITLAERSIFGSDRWVYRLLRYLKIKCIEQVMRYAANRVDIGSSSPYEVLEAIVATRVVTWENLEKAITDRTVICLEQFAAYPCTVMPLPLEFDMNFAATCQGTDCDVVWQKIEQRKHLWMNYLPTLHSVHAIPYIREGALSLIRHEPTKQHLQKFVDGQRSFAEIAEILAKDPLLLAPLYVRWVKEGLIDFNFGSCKLEKLPVILSVDDSPIVQTMIRRTLCESYEVICANSAIEALSILHNHTVDLILLDITMPEIDGFEFCHTIRKMNKFKNTPVIMLTAKDGLIDQVRGRMVGANHYLTKPVDREELLKTIKRYIP